MAQIFYRIVSSNSPTVDDFTSNAARGKPPRGMEKADPGLYRSISVYMQLSDAIDTQHRYPTLGSHIAEMEFADDDQDIALYRVSSPPSSHRSLQGEPAAFLRCVRRVILI